MWSESCRPPSRRVPLGPSFQPICGLSRPTSLLRPLGEARALKDFRGRDQVLAGVLHAALSPRTARLAQLHDLYAQLRPLGVEILAIPLHQDDGLDDAMRHLSLAFP